LAITKELFDALLDWLDPDRDTAGRRYEAIRAGLVRMFVSKGISDAGHSADEAMDRVMKRLPEIRASYVGDPAKYFHGVARNLIREAMRGKEVPTEVLPECLTKDPDISDTSECLSNRNLFSTTICITDTRRSSITGRWRTSFKFQKALCVRERTICELALKNAYFNVLTVMPKTKVVPDAIDSSGDVGGAYHH
jgi:hypothetical protein